MPSDLFYGGLFFVAALIAIAYLAIIAGWFRHDR